MSQHLSWPSGQLGAISLSFDDGMDSHLEAAIPELEKRDFRGTFYVTAGDGLQRNAVKWREVHNNGHEIGNHSVSHPCCLNVVGPQGLASWTLERMEADLLEAEKRLNAVCGANGGRSFAYPCYETDVGHGANRQSYVPLVTKHFPCARAKGLSKNRANHPMYSDLHCLSCVGVENADSQELVGIAYTALREEGWMILTFHGIDEGHLPVARYHLQHLLNFLDRERERIWCAPVVEVGKYIAEQRQREQQQQQQ